MKITKPTLKKIIFLINTLFMFGVLNAQKDSKQFFVNAKNEIDSMLSDKKPLDYERVVFITENAFYANSKHYNSFLNEISYIENYLRVFGNNSLLHNKIEPHKNILVSKDSVYNSAWRLANNYAIFKFITDTSFMISNNQLLYHLPYNYAFQDPFATENWENSHVINLLNNKIKTGNCLALASLFKILSLRLKTNANLCVTQGHIFISHKNENGISFNIELGAKTNVGSGSIEILTHTTDESVRSGINMRELDLKQSIALCLVNLAKAYQYKYSNKTDNFLLDCAELTLKYDSLNLNAKLLKVEVLEERLVKQNKDFPKLKITKDFLVYQNCIKELYNLGYREMPLDMKNKILSAVTKDTNFIAPFKNNTYNPFASISKNYDRIFSMTNGVFEEVDVYKPQEKYFRALFDVKTKKIIAFTQLDTLYKPYNIDPVVFAWNIDPLFRKYPNMSPYSAFANNPILFIDTDGQEFITYVKLKDEETGKLVMHKVTFDGTNITAQNAKTGTNANYKSGDNKFVDNIVASYNYIVSNGADVDNAMQKVAKSSIQVQIIEEKMAGEYSDGKIEYDFNYGLEVFDEKGNSLGVQSPALGFWSEVYHGYIDLIDNEAKDKYSGEKSQEQYVHLKKEPVVIDKLKEKDATNKESKRKTYDMKGGDAYPIKTKDATNPETKNE